MTHPRKVATAISILSALALLFTLAFYLYPRSNNPNLPRSVKGVQPGLSHASPDIAFPVIGYGALTGDLSLGVEANGTIRGLRDVDLVARVGGFVDSVAVRNGQLVHKGDLLVRLDQRELFIALEKTRTSLVSAQVEYHSSSESSLVERNDTTSVRQKLDEVHAKQKALELLHLQGKMTGQDYAARKRDLGTEEAYSSLRRGDVISSHSGLNQAIQDYENAKLNFEWSEIRAPFDGAVANLTLTPYATVTSGTVVCRCVDIANLAMDVQVLEVDAGKVHAGCKANISVPSFPSATFRGILSSLNPCVDPKSHTIQATVSILPEIPSHGSVLRAGMSATIRLESEVLTHRILVPTSAVLVRDQRSLVFVARNGRAQWEYVSTGNRNESMVEILSGVQSGDTVLTDGHYTLAHDAPIKVQMAK